MTRYPNESWQLLQETKIAQTIGRSNFAVQSI